MSEEIDRLEATIKRIGKEVVLQGERITRLEEASKKLDKIAELDGRVTSFVEDVEAARRDRTLRDYHFNENQKELKNRDNRLRTLEGGVNDDSR